jgi:hypothetical protein
MERHIVDTIIILNENSVRPSKKDNSSGCDSLESVSAPGLKVSRAASVVVHLWQMASAPLTTLIPKYLHMHNIQECLVMEESAVNI